MEATLPTWQRNAYRDAIARIHEAAIPALVAGAFALHHYTGLWRDTKDFDFFLKPEDRDRALAALEPAGFVTEVTAPHWLAKAFRDGVTIDLITGSGNWLQPVDDSWLQAGEPARVLGLTVKVISVTELIWSKAYVAGRERFDGADIVHLIRYAGDRIDWTRLVDRFGDHWELLLSYLNLYRFVFPSERDNVPTWVVEELSRRLLEDLRDPKPADVPFRGPLLDRYGYLFDLDQKGEPDPRERVAERRDLPVVDVEASREEDRERLESGLAAGPFEPTPTLERIEVEGDDSAASAGD